MARPSNKTPDIVGMIDSFPLPLSHWQINQKKLLDAGYKMTASVDAIACPECGGKARVYIELSCHKFSCSYSLCLCCWTVVEEYPVYEGATDDAD